MIETLDQLDTQIFLFFNRMHCSFFDNFMMLFTSRFIWVPMYATILYMLMRNFGWKRAAVYTIAIALTITLADQICATFIRPAVERLRPSNLNNPLSEFAHIVDGYRGGSYGFPSCHGANSFALAVVLSLIFRHRRCSMFVLAWATVNSYSRLYLGVHYPGDLLVGAAIGSVSAVICYYVAAFAIRHFVDKTGLPERNDAAVSFPVGLRIENSVIRVITVTMRISDIMIVAGGVTLLFITAAAAIG